MYSKPDLTNATDRLAHMLSEMHNERAPIGWERYRSLANLLMAKFPIERLRPIRAAGKLAARHL